MKKKILKNNKGFSLIEIILAMGIFSLVASSMISLVLGGNVALIQGGEQTTAEGLAEEALEAVRSIREGAWNELVFAQSAISTSSGEWIFSGEGTDETIGQYNRLISFNEVCRDMLHNTVTCPGAYEDKHSKELKAEITWEIRPGVTNTVERTTYITNWDSRDWAQTDWTAGSGQAIWSNESQYDNDDGNIDYSTPGEVKLASLGSGGCGVKTWEFTSASNYSFGNDIEIAGGAAQLVAVTASSWWDASYLSRKEISITNAGTIALTDFPVYLNILKETEMQTDYDDIRFIDGPCSAVGTELNYEIEYGDAAEAHIWVRLPELALSSDTICMYYNNPLATSGQNTPGVWDNNHVAVHHLQETSGTHFDSKGPNDGINNGSIQNATGIIDGANNFNSSDDYINIGNDTSLEPTTAVTFSVWAKSNDTTTQWESLGGNAVDTGWSDGYGLFFNSASTINFYVNAYTSNFATGSITPTNWNHIVGTYDSTAGGTTEIKVYVNGSLAGTDNYSSAISYAGGAFTIGDLGNWNSDWFNGFIDEVRISNIARSADWINQNYQLIANQNSYVSFANSETSASYPDTNPAIRPIVTHSVSDLGNWTSFSETANKNGTSEIYYQLSNDDGSTWSYWNGSTWAVALLNDYNIASDINANINTFATTTAQISFKAFLESDGNDQVQLDSISISCEKNHDWNFEIDTDYTFDSTKIEVTGGVAQLTNSSGSGSTADSEFNYASITNTSWPFDTASNYTHDSSIEVTGGVAQLIGTNSNTFRVTEYYLPDGNFTGTDYDLTLHQDLATNYFAIVQGSDGDGTANNTRNGDDNSVSLSSDPFGTGDLGVSGSNDVISLFRNGAVNSWVGVVTVVECLSDCSASGFDLIGVERVSHSGTSETGTDISSATWTDIDQVMLMGGFNGSGCDTVGAGATHIKACQSRIWPSGTNTINWQRDVTGGALADAVSTVMLVEWGSEWGIQRVTVSGSAGGNGANATGEYNTATINSVTRDNTWVWGTGWTNDGGIGDAAEGTLITLGDGVNQNTTETTVAVGQEYSDTRSFEVYALTHNTLRVDYRYKSDADSTAIIYDQATDTISDQTARMALVTNGCNGTGTAYPRPMFSARYLDDSTIRLERRRSGQNFPAWVQGIDFSAIKTPLVYPTNLPNIYPTSPYSLPEVQSWDSFSEIATANGGNTYYQLSDDNGLTWQYWNGSSWAIATSANDANTANIINTNISNFPVNNEQIKFRAFLESDSTQLVQIDNVDIGFTPPASPWTFSTWDVGGGEVAPDGLLQITGGNPDEYIDIYVPKSKDDEIGGYWEQAFEVTANNPATIINFDYSVIDYNKNPKLAEIRVYLDSAPGDPANQVGSSIDVSGTTSWINATTINDALAITTSGTYYLKIALWIESGKNHGPYEIGFDNVILNWSSSGYPSDSPTIQPSSAYTVTNLDKYNNFIENATKNGTSEIYYQLSSDSGATWEYWNGSTWTTASATNYNIATDINSNISSFATTSASITFKAFLESDGTDQVQLDNIRIGWGEPSDSGGYQTTAYLISSAYDMSDASPVQVLEWGETSVTGGDIKLQIRTAPDSSNSPGTWTSWYGAGGDGTYFTNPEATILSTILNGNRWLQYRAELSGNGSDTPILEEVIINYK